jgi:ATP-binding cassette subfamily B protein
MFLENRTYSTKDIIKIPFKAAPIYSILIGLQKLLGGIVPTLQVIVTARFIDTAISVVAGKKETSTIFPSLTAVVALIAYDWISYQLIKFVEVKMELTIRSKFRTAVTEKRAKLSYKHIENTETWDLISRVSREPEVQIKNAYKDMLSMVSMIIKIGGILFVLFAQVWWVAFVILGFSIPLFYLALKSGKANYDASREVSKYKRKYEYLGEVLSGRDAVEERTLFGFGDKINKKWWEQYEIARKIEFRTERKWFIKMKTGSLLTALVSILIVGVLINPVQTGAITIGMFISLVNAVFGLVQMMSWELTYQVDQLAKNKEYLKDLTEFASLEETLGATDKPIVSIPKFTSLEFRKVGFKYPGTDNYILKDASFIIEEGKHYAFVGTNGAGKTTITKLITGLYDNYEGEILVNKRSIKEYSQSELKSICSVVYQDFAKYSISLKDNISIGRVEGMGSDENNKLISEAVSVIELSDVIEKLPEGMETPLGKIKKSGLDISGGEWQRIAMARAIINPAPLRILDEPTAALDPISESRVYEKFEETSKGSTTIFISHRLGSTKLADEILVIANGAIIEKGTHNELMDTEGIYAQMYESQRGWYQ